jgi:hypothetical protein
MRLEDAVSFLVSAGRHIELVEIWLHRDTAPTAGEFPSGRWAERRRRRLQQQRLNPARHGQFTAGKRTPCRRYTLSQTARRRDRPSEDSETRHRGRW